jgi:hypothetical protein
MLNLRLTSRAIHEKAFSFFNREAFRRVHISSLYESFQWLSEKSQHAGTKTEQLAFSSGE